MQTIKGSASFYEQAQRHPATLRKQVTSPGGTSAEALYYLEKAGFRTAISRAVWAAYQRSMEQTGMKYEGLLRRHTIHPNVSAEPRDSLMYARVR